MNFSGKTFTFICKYIALIWIVCAGSVAAITGSATADTGFFICMVGIVIANLGLPVDISKIINNYKGHNK